ncbi:MAG: M23 family metallopeptidase, partial [Candidatus Omnitrophica bacterium]|nr:M23 family metallopeptidase [Candidatus Omnitrophota bacterium]
MKKYIIVILCWSFLMIAGQAMAKELMLPYDGGSTWTVSQGWNMQAPTHTGKWAHSWDFAVPQGKPVLAVANGTVVYARWEDRGILGYLVIIKFDDETYGKCCHLLNTTDHPLKVSEGNLVSQGQIIGYCGNTGSSSKGAHIHYNTQEDDKPFGQSIESTFLDAEEADRIPKRYGYYTSMNIYSPNSYRIGKFADSWKIRNFPPNPFNTNFVPLSRPFAITYFHVGKPDKPGDPNKLGNPINAVHLYPEYYPWHCYNNISGESVWVQDTESTNGDGKVYTLVLNPYVINLRLDYLTDSGSKYWLGVVFSLEGLMRNYWFDHYCELGPPASELFEETINGIVYKSQMFENGDNNYIKVSYNDNTKVFNNLEYVCDDHVNQSVYDNLGCPNGDCGTGGGDPNPEPTPNPNPGISCNKEIGFTPEGFTRVDQVCYRQPFYNNYPIRETA